MTRWPARSKLIANGTMPGSEFFTGAADSRPSNLTPNTSMSLPLALVVTISCRPSGENATWPGVLVNCGVADGSRPRAPVGAGNRREPAAKRPVALDRAAVLRVQHVHQVAAGGHADRELAA